MLPPVWERVHPLSHTVLVPHDGAEYRAGAKIINPYAVVTTVNKSLADSAINVGLGTAQTLQINLQRNCDLRTTVFTKYESDVVPTPFRNDTGTL